MKNINVNEAGAELIALAERVTADAAKHRYSVSSIYTAYNAITGKAEEPQTCSSCLRSRAREIAKWLDGRKAPEPVKEPDPEPVKQQAPEPVEEPAPEPVEEPAPEIPSNVARLNVDGIGEVDFTPIDGVEFADGVKGTVLGADGSNVKPGTYSAGEFTLKVQPGGKATVVLDLAS